MRNVIEHLKNRLWTKEAATLLIGLAGLLMISGVWMIFAGFVMSNLLTGVTLGVFCLAGSQAALISAYMACQGADKRARDDTKDD